MKTAFRSKPPRYPGSWDEFPAGENIKLAVEQVCNEYAERIFGYHFVKLGNLSAQIQLNDSPIHHRINHTPDFTCSERAKDDMFKAVANGEADERAHCANENFIIGQAHKLPFSENSIDGLLLANELDFAQDPHEILREVDRVITQDGHVIISGFNPLSLAGVAKYLPVKRDNILHDARFFTTYRMKDWLHLLGFEVIEQRQILFSTLFFQQRWEGAAKLQHYLSSYFPWCSAVYVILAKKRVFPMTAIRPKRALKPQFSAVGASARTTSQKQKSHV
ncbi:MULTISPECIES: class I SAM-dependent methyltransferase [Alteromonas]|uniref:class I SAM-dependent methyltransferase n=1 Tax=Alteromonas TaxID=226 RepID=UPI002FE1270B|tara:strand:+ start:3884 stop:4714 length:831 start_codon:yes stop_codon:yes gene_type:complete